MRMSRTGGAEKRKMVKLLEGIKEFQQAMSSLKNNMSEGIRTNADVKGRVLCSKKKPKKTNNTKKKKLPPPAKQEFRDGFLTGYYLLLHAAVSALTLVHTGSCVLDT